MISGLAQGDTTTRSGSGSGSGFISNITESLSEGIAQTTELLPVWASQELALQSTDQVRDLTYDQLAAQQEGRVRQSQGEAGDVQPAGAEFLRMELFRIGGAPITLGTIGIVGGIFVVAGLIANR